MNSFIKQQVLLVLCTAFMSSMLVAEEIKKQYIPVDSDNDGVLDGRDECYKTPPGTKVDEYGCEIRGTTTKEIRLNVNFDFDSSVVNPKYYGEVQKIADFMAKHPLSYVIIEGHTDSDGSDDYNKRLSQNRALAVVGVLTSRFGVTSRRVGAIGFGEEKPLVANDSEANKLKNRRVVAVIRQVSDKR